MKPVLETIHPEEQNQSFMAYVREVQRFDFQWHYHPEYELTYIIKGEGKRLVGDSHENFTPGDLVLIGPSLPHTWVSNQLAHGNVSAVVIQFPGELVADFYQYPECAYIRSLLDRSTRGLHFSKTTASRFKQQIHALPGKAGLDRIFALLKILQELGCKKSKALSTLHYQSLKGKEHETRINKVCGYIQQHFSESLSIHRVALLIHLSDSAFCRFFKKATGKTFSDYVNELRIGQACHLLTATDKSISEIATLAGFETLTYFNRVFLAKKKQRPKDFRQAAH